MYGLISAFATYDFLSFWWLITRSLLKLSFTRSFTFSSQFVNSTIPAVSKLVC